MMKDLRKKVPEYSDAKYTIFCKVNLVGMEGGETKQTKKDSSASAESKNEKTRKEPDLKN